MGDEPTAFARTSVLPGACGFDWVQQGAEYSTLATPLLSDVPLC